MQHAGFTPRSFIGAGVHGRTWAYMGVHSKPLAHVHSNVGLVPARMGVLRRQIRAHKDMFRSGITVIFVISVSC
eukprot:scaffold5824_cov81-Skeletonema_marinoi.AAC.2